MIETDRIRLRKFTLDDLDDAYEMNADPEVRKYIVGEGEPTRENVYRLIKDNTLADYEKCGYGRLAIVYKPDNKFIGFTGIKHLDDLDEVDVGYRLKREYWGKGLATEATQSTIEYGFRKLGLNRIIAGALPENAASIRVMEKLGMHYEKTMIYDGHEMVVYVIERQATAD